MSDPYNWPSAAADIVFILAVAAVIIAYFKYRGKQ